jgi:hypothetical protein
VDLELGPLSLVNTTEELLGRKSSGSGLETREYGRWITPPLHPQKLALTSPKSGARSVGVVRSRTQATEFSFFKAQFMVHYDIHVYWKGIASLFNQL